MHVFQSNIHHEAPLAESTLPFLQDLIYTI